MLLEDLYGCMVATFKQHKEISLYKRMKLCNEKNNLKKKSHAKKSDQTKNKKKWTTARKKYYISKIR